MQNIKIEEKYIIEYINDMLMSMKANSIEVQNARYHHNTPYEKTPRVIYHGLLSNEQLARLNNKELTDQDIKLLSDEALVNGKEYISLSAVGLSDLDKNKLVYNPYSSWKTDILISNDVKAYRRSTNYDNEFLVKDRIDNIFFRAIDFRILKLVTDGNFSEKDRTATLIKYYNYLKLIAQALIDTQLDIPLREMTKENITLDIEKVVNVPNLTLK